MFHSGYIPYISAILKTNNCEKKKATSYVCDLVQVQRVIELFGKQVNNALNMHYHKKTRNQQPQVTWDNILFFCFCVFAHFSKFSMYDWGKKRNMLVFTGVYVCVKAKLTFVSFFFKFFF